MKGSGDFSIGSQVWPGTSKLTEEMGELQQVIGKLIAIAGDTDHWSGDLRQMLVEEMGDVMAALAFFEEKNLTPDERIGLGSRAEKKLTLFRKWHTEGRGPDNPEPVVKIRSHDTSHLPPGKVIFLHINRPRSLEQSQELDAATEWLLAELGEPVFLQRLRLLAEYEINRPRDALHKRWAECFLKETERYTREAEEREI